MLARPVNNAELLLRLYSLE